MKDELLPPKRYNLPKAVVTAGLAFVLVATLLAPALSGGNTQTVQRSESTVTEVDPPTTRPVPGVELGAPKPAGVEEFPVPSAAIRTSSSNSFEAYELPEMTTLQTVRDWYNANLPEGEPFDGWEWCKSQPGRSGDALERFWTQDANIVSVTTISHEDMPFIILIKNPESFSGCA